MLRMYSALHISETSFAEKHFQIRFLKDIYAETQWNFGNVKMKICITWDRVA